MILGPFLRSFIERTRYLPIVKAHAPAAQIWAGEDGPTGGGDSGTCGSDDTSICGLYGTVLWYADDMALRAQHSFKQYLPRICTRYAIQSLQITPDSGSICDRFVARSRYQRQDLVGGRYSLVGQHFCYIFRILNKTDVESAPDFCIFSRNSRK